MNLSQAVYRQVSPERTIAYFATAATYVLGQRAGAYYYANQEEIHLHIAIFAEAVTIGTRRAFAGTIAAGRAARVAAADLAPAIETAWARHHVAFAPIQRFLYTYASR